MKKINIAIDGPSAAGKSTIAKLLAKKLGYTHLDTGAMYRCVAYATKQNMISFEDEEAILQLMHQMEIRFDEKGNVLLNNQDVSREIRNNEISMLTSKISIHPLVRQKLVEYQQEMAKEKGFILDGRDIGTVVLPDAELKIYMVASVEARAERRYQEYLEKNIDVSYDVIYKDIEERDYQDIHRKTSPLTKAIDAVEIDTSTLEIKEVVDKVCSLLSKLK